MPIDDRALASCLMYPKVFVDFAKAGDLYGPVSVLPTPVFFYGLPVGKEILVVLEKAERNGTIAELLIHAARSTPRIC